MPITAEMETTVMPINSEMREPKIMRLKTSLPRASVPSRCAPLGLARTLLRS